MVYDKMAEFRVRFSGILLDMREIHQKQKAKKRFIQV